MGDQVDVEPNAKCSVPLEGGEECPNDAVRFDWDWDAYECECHIGWWDKQAREPR